MANKPLKSVQFPGLDDTYTIPQVDTTLAVTGAAADSKKVGDEITELKADFTQLDGKIAATMITNTASGAIASFPDGADGVPVKDMTVDIEPVQDLHGQASPYPGGASANLLDYGDISNSYRITSITEDKRTGRFTVVASGASASIYHTIPVEAGETYIIYAFASENVSGNASQINVCDVYDGDTTSATKLLDSTVYAGSGVPAKQFVPTGNVVLVRCHVTGGTGSGTGTITKPQILKQSTKPTTYVPYENICPISGWTGANVSRTGKNILPITLSNLKTLNTAGTWSDNAYTYRGVTYTVNTDDGGNVESILVNGTAQYVSNLQLVANVNTLLTVGETYTLSGCASGGTSSTYYLTIATTPDTSRLAIDTGDSASFTCTSAYAETTRNGYITVAQGVSISNKTFKPMFEKGSSATAYVPYGNTYSITFPTEAGTVYGGTLDVTSGVLTVDRKLVDLGDRNWSLLGNTGSRQAWVAYFSEIKPPASGNTPYDAISSEFKGVSYNASWLPGVFAPTASSSPTGVAFCVESGKYADASEFKEAVTGVQFCYAIAEPQTYQLTPQEVSTLLGLNNIWADTGDVSVDYRADTKLYIEQLTAPSEDDMVANTNIPSDTYFMIGNTLFLSTTTIPAGDVINPGTNCTLMNLASALNALNS